MAQDIDWDKGEFSAPNAGSSDVDWDQGEFTPPPEKPGVLRGAADSALAFTGGIATGTKMVADAFGANNRVSRVAGRAEEALSDLRSPFKKQQQENRGRLIDEAEKSGSTLNQIGAYVGAFTEAPVDTTLNALGTSIPTLALARAPGLRQSAAATRAAQAGMGGLQGAGAAKGQIYDAVEQKWLEQGATPDQAAARAEEAQAYTGDNIGNIAAAGGLGVLAGTTGAESVARRVLGRQAAEQAADGATRGIVRGAAEGVLKEAPLEALQGGQERYTSNVALQREGFDDVGTWTGVAGQAALEGLASAPIGGGFGALDAASSRRPTPGRPATEQPAQPEADPFTTAPDMATDPLTGEIAAPPQEQATAVLPADSEQVSAPVTAPLPDAGITDITPIRETQTPSQAMGIDPNAGPLSKAAATAVDTGVSQEMQAQQAAQEMAQAEQEATKVAARQRPKAENPGIDKAALETRTDEELRGFLRSAQNPDVRKAVSTELAKRKQAAIDAMPDPLQPSLLDQPTPPTGEPARVAETAQAVERSPEEPQAPAAQPAGELKPLRGILAKKAEREALGRPLTDTGAGVLGSPADPLQAVIQGENDARRATQPTPEPAPADAGSSSPVPQADQPATGPLTRPPRWRNNALQAGKVARDMGLDPKGKRLEQILAEIDAVDAGTNVQDAPQGTAGIEAEAAPVEARAPEGGDAAAAGGVPATTGAGDGQADGVARQQTREERQAAINAETMETRKPVQVAQPTPMKRVTFETMTLSGPKKVSAKLYELPGYDGPQIAVAEYKTSRGTGYKIYLPKSGAFIHDSNGVSPLKDALELAVLRIRNARETLAQAEPSKSPAPAQKQPKSEQVESIKEVANQAATSPKNDLPQPTDAQKEAGNYQKGHKSFNGFDISIENPAGSKRRPEWPPLKNHYGYFKGSIGADKDHVDVFLTDRADDPSLPVFVVDQTNRDGTFDEHKVIMGTANEAEARATYLQNYEKGWTGLGAITEMSQDEFKAWVRDPAKTKKPVALKRGVLAKMAEQKAAEPADVEAIRRQLVEVENKIVGAAGLSPDFIEDAMKSRNVPLPLKKQRKELKDQLRAAPAPQASSTQPSAQADGQVENDRDTFTLERVNRETNKMEPVTFERGEYITYKVGSNDQFGEIDGISQARREFSVDGLWHPMGFAYKTERPAAPKPETVPLSSVIDKMNAKNGEGLTEADRVPEKKPASKTPAVDRHNEVMQAVRDGKANAEQFKASFEEVVANKPAIVAELSTKTKAQLLQELNGWHQQRYANENKSEVVDALYRDMVGEYVLGESLSYGMGKGAYEAAVRAKVEATDADKLARYVEDRRAAIAEAMENRKARAAAMENPQTLDDFRSVVKARMMEGQSRKEAFLSLTPEQRIKYDELEAESTREARETRKRTQKTEVRAAGQTTGGEIIATKHTKTGADLYVVQLSDRLSREDYTTVLASAKRMGGWYSSFRGNGAVPGFQFKTRDAADAFVKLAGGDTTDAKAQAEQRRDAFADDRSQSAVERLNEMAEKIEVSAQEDLNRDRKTNTARRARFAASAERAAEAEKALARTMRNIAQAIDSGKAKFLDAVRMKTQVEAMTGYVRTAKDNELRAKYPAYADQEKRRGEPPTAETADFAEFPTFSAYRSDLASLARQMIEVEGTKKLGTQLMKLADDVTDAYLDFAKKPENLLRLSTFSYKRGDDVKTAIFASRDTAEQAIKRSGLTGKAIVLVEKRGVNRIIMSPSEAMNQRIWDGDGDKRITLTPDGGSMLVEAIGRRGDKKNGLTVPWQFQTAYDRRKALARMGIETPSEFRSALREFIALQERATANKVRGMELAMVGKKNDGLDFFPTPQDVADQMVEAADIQPDMAVLEPSAGMGHIADRIRAAGAEPDVIEISPDRRELLLEKGYHIAEVDDFTAMQPRKFFTYGDVFRAPDGTEGIMRGVSQSRVRLEDEAGNRLGLYDRDELTGIRHQGSWSGYDRIIMNPPFSNRQDAEHVQHAYTLLKPGGRVVAIMGEGVFFGKDKKAQDFREWMDSVGGTDEKLPAGSFMDPSLPVNTGVSARMVVIDKPEGDTQLRMADPTQRATPSATSTAAPANQAIVQSLSDSINAQRATKGSPAVNFQAVEPAEGTDGQLARAIAKTAKRIFNREVVYVRFDGQPLFNGAVSKLHPGKIFINIDSERPMMAVLGHELLHELAKSNPGTYANLSRRLDRVMRNQNIYSERLKAKYRTQGQPLPADIMEELEADIVGDNFMDPLFWQEMSQEQPGLFRAMANQIIRWLDKVAGQIRRMNPFGTEQYLTDIAAARSAVAEAMREFSRNQVAIPADVVADTTADAVAQFSIADTASRTADRIKAFNVKGKPANTLKHYRGMAMQALGRRQIVDLYANELPQLESYNDLVQSMDAEKNDMGAEADAVARDWGNLDSKTGVKGEELRLAELMHDATLAQIDPSKPLQPGDNLLRYAGLKSKYDKLHPESRALFNKSRDMYANHFAKVKQAIAERIERSDMSPSQKKKLMARMDDDFFKKTKGVYFPLARFGKYVVVVKDANGEVVSVNRAETINEANTTRDELLKVFPKQNGYAVGKVLKDKEYNPGRDAAGKGFMADLFEVLDKTNASAELKDSVGQLYLASLPDLSWAKHGIHRKGTPGFSQDARRAFAQNMFHGARHLAKLRYADRLQTELDAMQEHVEAYRDVEEYDSIKAQQVVDEMIKRHESLMSPQANAVSTALTSAGFVFFLGISPAAAMVNLSQTALVAYPIMGAKWGFTKSANALLRASRETIAAKNDISKALKGDELAAYEQAVKDGTIDVTMAHDLAGISQGEDEKVVWAMRPVMRWASFLFHHAERFNRQATFLASYRLAKESGRSNDEAFRDAKQATYDGHFDYGAANRPRLMQGNWAKVLLLFKQYAQNMVYTLSRQAYLSMKGMTPAERTQARKSLGGILALHAAAAGALGLPLVGPLLAAASFIGGDDDEPWDAEIAMKNMLSEAFGPKAAEVMAHGLSRLTPWDISSRVALNNLILPDIQEGLEGQRLSDAMAAAALGPVWGMFSGAVKGMGKIADGEYGRGLEDMLPVALRNPVKAARYASEGSVDRSGVVIKDEVSIPGVLGQASGFAPSEVRAATERRRAIYDFDRARMERRSTLMAQFASARMAGDDAGMAEVREEIQRFNEKNPKRRITPVNLMQSVRARQRRIAQADEGVYLPKNRRDAVDSVTF